MKNIPQQKRILHLIDMMLTHEDNNGLCFHDAMTLFLFDCDMGNAISDDGIEETLKKWVIENVSPLPQWMESNV